MGLMCFTASKKESNEIMDIWKKRMLLKNCINESWGIEKLKYYLLFIEVDNELKRRCGKKITQKRVYTLKQKRIRLKKSKLHNNFGEKRNKKGGKEK